MAYEWLSRDCPYCGAGLIAPKSMVEQGVNEGKIIDCPSCDEPYAIAGEWEPASEPDMSNWEATGDVV